ncbi:MAG: c-type cytochrome [Rubrimonas sp.]|uniref:c-type cytochrome n=1 Tax=Rubrimonas sp. TaxID=2036015 RepID=UPI002FDE5164
MGSTTTVRAAALAAAGLLAGAASAQQGDAKRGEWLFGFCATCHEIGEDAQPRIGPPLTGVVNRPAAAVEDFPYSGDMRRAAAQGLVWTDDKLDAYIANPHVLVSRTPMTFPGFPEPQDRADIIAYLHTHSPDAPELAALTGFESTPRDLLELSGDPAYGEYLAAECVTCHQADGADRGIPGIFGWYEEDFKAALHAYRVKLRENATMQTIAGGLGDEEIAALAAWFGKGAP